MCVCAFQNSSRVELGMPEQNRTESNGYEYLEVWRSLTVTGAQAEDAGVYTCTVTTHDGKQSSRQLTLQVYGQYS